MASVDRDAVLNALRVVVDPDLRRDIVSLGFVKDLAIADGRASFTIELTTPACPVKDQMRDQAVAAVRALPGVADVDVQLTAKVRSASAPETGRPPLPGVKNVIAVGAGKGGVGKTTVAVNLALALAQCGSRVGILDGDIYGPNVPIMLGLNTQLTTDGKQIVPAEKYGMQVVSIGFLTNDDAPIIWRGPMLHGAIQQFFREVAWNDLDYLIVDMPPGTGDVALSLSQTVPVVGVDRRDDAAAGVARRQPARGADVSEAQHPDARHRREHELSTPAPTAITKRTSSATAAARRWPTDMDVPFLGRLPIYQPIREGSDTGVPLVVSEPASAAARAFLTVAERTAAQVSIAAHKAAEANKGKIPLIPVRYERRGSTADASSCHRSSVHQAHARQRPRRDRPRGSSRADRRREHLVSRRVQERAAGPHRLRASLRAPDVRRARSTTTPATSRRCSRPARC